MGQDGRDAAACHDEVLAALQALGDARRGEAVRRDRGSALPHLGIAVPVLRARVKQGFSFSQRPWAGLRHPRPQTPATLRQAHGRW